MKAVLIGSDFLLDDNGNAKILEMNTNASVYQSMLPHFDFSPVVELIEQNSINEVVYIFTNEQIVTDPSLRIDLSIGSKLQQLCQTLGIAYTPYQVNVNAMTVPYIEDAPNKLIFRQAFDSTALIDDEYCADKLNLQELIKDESYTVGTYASSTLHNIDTLNTLSPKEPNIVVKAKQPTYDKNRYPEVHYVTSNEQLQELKEAYEADYYLQEFINSDNNKIQGKYSIIRSFDLIYGSTLEVLHLGSYHQSSIIATDIWPNEYIDNTTRMTNKSRTKWLTKTVDDQKRMYHLDEETKVVAANGEYLLPSQLHQGVYIKSADFSNFPTGSLVDIFAHTSSFQEMHDSLTINTAQVVELYSASYEGVYVNITLEDGTNWDDSTRSTIYVEISGSTQTQFKTLGQVHLGDKIITVNHNTNELERKEVVEMSANFDTKIIYEVDVEEQDIFLSILNEEQGTALVQHNPCWCSGYNCGWSSCANYCAQCSGGCFIGETIIETVEGPKQIKDIQIGDLIDSYDILKNDIVTKRVTGLWKSEYDSSLVIINGIKTKGTIGHPFVVKDVEGNISFASYDPNSTEEFAVHENIILEKLEINGKYVNISGEWKLIDKLELEPYQGIVYNLTVEDTHTYIANNFVVHNIKKEEFQ
jgi:hypothetical protein